MGAHALTDNSRQRAARSLAQVRGYRAWYWHFTLSMTALVIRVIIRAGAKPDIDRPLNPSSVNEIRRLWNRLANPPRQPVDHGLHWST